MPKKTQKKPEQTKEKAKTGRPEWIPPDLKRVEQYAAQGMTQDQIADALGINRSTLYAKKKQYKDFSDAIDRGKAQGIRIVTSRLMQQVESGNTDAIKFYLARRADWRETTNTDNTHKVQIMDKEHIKKVIKVAKEVIG